MFWKDPVQKAVHPVRTWQEIPLWNSDNPFQPVHPAHVLWFGDPPNETLLQQLYHFLKAPNFLREVPVTETVFPLSV